jgi:hypothetical protein
MKVQQTVYRESTWDLLSESAGFETSKAQLVLAFGERKCLEEYLIYKHLREKYPDADCVISSTAGEIYGNSVYENSIVVTAIQFESTRVRTVQFPIQKHTESGDVGDKIGLELVEKDLASLILISDGGRVNGSALLASLNTHIDAGIPISGGLAGDEARFEKTLVGLNQEPQPGYIVGIGLYGKNLKVGNGTKGGWDVFGPERQVSHSEYNTLFTIGETAALDLYKEYLGRFAEELPAAALHFPLSMRLDTESEPVVRTILSIDEAAKSMTFAGDIPQGAWVRFMKANFDRLIDASASAASSATQSFEAPPELALLVSCVGRKLALGFRTEEEIEVVRELVGPDTIITGFYSYGEISQIHSGVPSELHNQTMTITTLSEI